MLVLVVLTAVVAVAVGLTALTWQIAVGTSAHADHGVTHGTARVVRAELRAHGRLAGFVRRRTNPRQVTGLALTLALGALAVVGVLLYQVRTDSAVVDVDRDVSGWSAEEATATSTDVLRVLTDAGGTTGVVLVGIAVAMVEARRAAARGVIAFLVVVIGGQLLLTNLVKLLVERDRPDVHQLAGATGFSFPSGHSAGAAACFAACALCLGRGRSRKVHLVLASLAAGVAVMVAASRVLLGVHWLSDVVAGLCFGSAWFVLCAIAFGGRLLHFGAPVEAAERAEALYTSAAGRDRRATGPTVGGIRGRPPD